MNLTGGYKWKLNIRPDRGTSNQSAKPLLFHIQSDSEYILTIQGMSETCKANARLIAAAPETAAERDRLKKVNAELLEALRECVTDDGAYSMTRDDIAALKMRIATINAIAKTVIAKAEGQ